MKTIFIILLSSFTSLNAQKIWSLQECFDFAIENNISIKQITLSKNFAENNVKQSKMNLYLPMANANVNEIFSFGNSVDPTTYQFIKQNTNSTSFGINASYGLFEGLSKINTLKGNKEKLSATEFEIEEIKNSIKMAITNLYLQITIAKDVLQIAKETSLLTLSQYSNTKALVDAGVQAKGTLFDIEAQVANDEFNELTAQNNLERALNQLKLLLQLDPYEEFEIQEINFENELVDFNIDPKNTSTRAIELMPQIKAADFRRKSAEYDLKIAKGSLFPSLSISGNIGTRYFSEAQYVTGNKTIYNVFEIDVLGTKIPVKLPQDIPTLSKTPFMKQLGDNLNQNISIGLNIPILGGWQRRTAIANAEINLLKSNLDIETKKNKIKEDVFIAYTDLKLAQKRFKASQKSAKASNEAYHYANEKFKVGMMNSLEFETTRNRKINAQSNLMQAKYDLFFKKLILDFYETGELKF